MKDSEYLVLQARREAMTHAIIDPFMRQMENIGPKPGEVTYDRELKNQEIRFLKERLKKYHYGLFQRMGYLIRAGDGTRTFTAIEVKAKGRR